jgi:hypothetical protein
MWILIEPKSSTENISVATTRADRTLGAGSRVTRGHGKLYRARRDRDRADHAKDHSGEQPDQSRSRHIVSPFGQARAQLDDSDLGTRRSRVAPRKEARSGEHGLGREASRLGAIAPKQPPHSRASSAGRNRISPSPISPRSRRLVMFERWERLGFRLGPDLAGC